MYPGTRTVWLLPALGLANPYKHRCTSVLPTAPVHTRLGDLPSLPLPSLVSPPIPSARSSKYVIHFSMAQAGSRHAVHGTALFGRYRHVHMVQKEAITTIYQAYSSAEDKGKKQDITCYRGLPALHTHTQQTRSM